MSALGADRNAKTPYYRTKAEAEIYVLKSGLNYTIFRPSFIYGPGDAVYSMLANMIKKSPLGLLPVFGLKTYKHQPIAAFDVAKGFVHAIENEKAFHKTYEIGGPEPISYKNQLRIIGKTIDKKVRLLPQPLFISRILVGLMSIFPFSPIDQDRLSMLTKNNICDPMPFSQDLRIDLTPFEEGISYLKNQ